MPSYRAPSRRRAARPRVPVALLGAFLAAASMACRPAEAPPPHTPVLRVSTAFGPLSLRLIEEYRRTVPGVEIRQHQSPSSGDTLRLIQAGEVDLGVVLADDAYRAYWDEATAEARADSRVRGVSLLQPLPMYLVVRPGSGIHSVGDLKGRSVAVGTRNNSTWKLATLVLDAFDLHPVTIKEYQTRAAAAEDLKKGALDAMVLPGYVYPDEQTAEVMRSGGYLVPIEGPPIDQLRRDSPFIRAVMVPRDLYPGQDCMIATVGIDMVIVCSRDLDEPLVYQLTQQLFNVFPRLAGIEANLRFLNLDEAPATPIPLHPGAARYFRERELSR